MGRSLATLLDMPPHTSMSERIPRMTTLDPETGCLIWKEQSSKYVSISWKGRSELAHRVAWEEVHGPIPEGMTIDHLCRNQRCVNVEHMEVVSRGDNVRRHYAQQETCKNGHPYAEPSPHYVKVGWRRCRTCATQKQREYRARSR